MTGWPTLSCKIALGSQGWIVKINIFPIFKLLSDGARNGATWPNYFETCRRTRQKTFFSIFFTLFFPFNSMTDNFVSINYNICLSRNVKNRKVRVEICRTQICRANFWLRLFRLWILKAENFGFYMLEAWKGLLFLWCLWKNNFLIWIFKKSECFI